MRIEARVKTKNRIKQADTNIELAEAEAAAARDAYRRQQLARRRVDDIMAVLDHRFRDGQPNKQEAEPFVRALLFTLMWEQAGNRSIAAKFTANAFPDFDLGELLALAADACAHHARLWNKPLIDQPKFPSKGEIPLLDHLAASPHSNKRIYAACAIARYLLLAVNPRTQWSQRLKDHIATFPENPYVTLNTMGFPKDWEKLPLWS